VIVLEDEHIKSLEYYDINYINAEFSILPESDDEGTKKIRKLSKYSKNATVGKR